MAKIKVDGYRCERCGYEWVPRKKNARPRYCPNPKCHNAYWDEPKKRAGSGAGAKAGSK
ncbi:MAG: hypothetical protein WD556_13405 [Actinomycetota bacterium]